MKLQKDPTSQLGEEPGGRTAELSSSNVGVRNFISLHSKKSNVRWFLFVQSAHCGAVQCQWQVGVALFRLMRSPFPSRVTCLAA